MDSIPNTIDVVLFLRLHCPHTPRSLSYDFGNTYKSQSHFGGQRRCVERHGFHDLVIWTAWRASTTSAAPFSRSFLQLFPKLIALLSENKRNELPFNEYLQKYLAREVQRWSYTNHKAYFAEAVMHSQSPCSATSLYDISVTNKKINVCTSIELHMV